MNFKIFKSIWVFVALILAASWFLCDPAEARGKMNEQTCLVGAAWHEARGLPPVEIRKVMHVVINRTKNPDYPKGVCAVVLQKGQFPNVRNVISRLSAAKSVHVLARGKSAEESELDVMLWIAEDVLSGNDADPTDGATHFYSPRFRTQLGLPARPAWDRKMKRTAVTKNFVFGKFV